MTQTPNTPFVIRAKRFTSLGIKGLRITPEHLARREADRSAYFADGFCEENIETEEGTVLRVTQLHQFYPKLYQESPREKSTFKPPNGRKHRCYTNSYESYKNKADKETIILETNNRLPTKVIEWNLFIVLSQEEIVELRTKVFNYLRQKGIEAVVAIELTYGENDRPNNTVHFHLLTDDPRSEKELENLLAKACERKAVGLVRGKDFKVRCRKLTRPEKYFAYFTKSSRTDKDWCKVNNKKRVLLFQKPAEGKTIQKFYEIGKWFRKSKPELWNEFREQKYGTKTYTKKTKQK